MLLPGIDVRDLYSRLGDDELLVIDCRQEQDWEQVPIHIPGALRMAVGELAEAAHILPDDELIVLCGADTNTEDARQAWQILRRRGRAALCLEGGLFGWLEHGYPAERHVPGQRRPHQDAMRLA